MDGYQQSMSMALVDLFVNDTFFSTVILPVHLPTSPNIDPVNSEISCPRSYRPIACHVAGLLPTL